jgi:hypothetical protein
VATTASVGKGCASFGPQQLSSTDTDSREGKQQRSKNRYAVVIEDVAPKRIFVVNSCTERFTISKEVEATSLKGAGIDFGCIVGKENSSNRKDGEYILVPWRM